MIAELRVMFEGLAELLVCADVESRLMAAVDEFVV